MSAIGIGHVEEKWRVTLSASVLNALQLRKKDQLIFYFDFDRLSESEGSRLVALSFPLTASCFQGETRGSQGETSSLIQRLASIGKFEELFIRRGRTNEYSINYVISIRDPEDGETALKDALNTTGKQIYNQRLISLGESGKIGMACFKPLLGRASFNATIDEKNRIWIPCDLDNFIVDKLGLDTAKFSIQTVDPSTGRLIMIFTSTEKLVDLSFTITELGQNDLADFMESLNILHLTPQALVKKATSSPIKCRVRTVVDYTNTTVGFLPQVSKQILNEELRPLANKIIHQMQEKRREESRDVVLDIELSVPVHDE